LAGAEWLVARRFELAIARRAAVLWLLSRIAASPLLAATGEHPVFVNPRSAMIVVAAVGALSWLDTRRRNEDLLLANLGTPRWVIHLAGLGPPAALEVLVAMIGSP
jgi:hypothetical protein